MVEFDRSSVVAQHLAIGEGSEVQPERPDRWRSTSSGWSVIARSGGQNELESSSMSSERCCGLATRAAIHDLLHSCRWSCS
jgi:hypothetical protein